MATTGDIRPDASLGALSPGLRSLIRAVRMRRLRANAIGMAGRAVVVAAIAACLGLIVAKIFAVRFELDSRILGLVAVGLPAVLVLPVVGFMAWSRRKGALSAAIEIDDHLGGGDLIASSVGFAGGASGPFESLTLRAAEEAARPVDASRVVPMHVPRAVPWGCVAMGLLGAGAWYLPAVPWTPPASGVPEREIAPAVVAAAETALEDAREAIEEASDDPAISEAGDEVLDALEAELADGTRDPDEIVARAASALEQLAEEASSQAEQSEASREAVADALSRVDPNSFNTASEVAESLAGGDFARARDSVDDLAASGEAEAQQDLERLARSLEETAESLGSADQTDADPASDAENPEELLRELAEAIRERSEPQPPAQPEADRPFDLPQPEPESQPDPAAPEPTPPPADEAQPPSDSPDPDAPSEEQAEQDGGQQAPPSANPGATPEPQPRDDSSPQPSPDPASEPQPQPQPDPSADSPSDQPPASSETQQQQEQQSQQQDSGNPGEQPASQPAEPSGAPNGAPQPGGQQPGQPQDQPGQQPDEQGSESQSGSEPTESGQPGDQGSPQQGSEQPPSSGQPQPGSSPQPSGGEPQPGGSPAPGAGSGQDGEPMPGGGGGDALDRLAEQQRQAQRQRDTADRLRQRADDMLGGGGTSPDGSPTGLPGAGGNPPATNPWEGPTDLVDARRQGDGNQPERVVAEWFRDPSGAPTDGRASDADAARRLREASRSADRAIEQQAVPRRHRDLIRQVFRRYADRAGPGEPSPTAPASDARDAE